MLKKNWLGISVIILSILIKLPIINYGLPHLFHNDEPYIYKDPFKLLLSYKNHDFSSTTNLFFWILQVWYFILFLYGILVNEWNNLEQFQHLLIIEDARIIFHGRLLSLILAAIGNFILSKLIFKISKDQWLRSLFILTIIFNPIELISNMWLKFDPACYLLNAILILFSYEYFTERKNTIRSKLYFTAILALAVRIDFIVMLASIFIIDAARNFKDNKFLFVKTLITPTLKGILTYSIITLAPITISYKILFPSNNPLLITPTFEEVIVPKLIKTFTEFDFYRLMGYMKFYMIDCLIITLSPSIILVMVYHYKKTGTYAVYLLSIILLLAILLLFNSHGAHYFLLLSELFLIIYCILVAQITNLYYARVLTAITFLYIASISIQAIYFIHYSEDPRITSKKYLLANTTKEDVIAINDFINPCYFPPIDECPETMIARAKITRESGMGTGKTLEEKAELVNKNDCRSILEISEKDRFSNTAYKGKWINDYDTSEFKTISPKFLVAEWGLPTDGKDQKKKFFDYINKNYSQDNVFEITFFDPRVNIIQKEPIFTKILIFKKDFHPAHAI